MAASKPAFGPAREAHEALRREHQEVLATLDRLEEARDVGEIAAILHALIPRLRDHFEDEERPGGLYERVGATRGRFVDEVRGLVDDHFRIMSAIQATRPIGAEHQELTLRFARDLARWLREHERRERDLARRADIDD